MSTFSRSPGIWSETHQLQNQAKYSPSDLPDLSFYIQFTFISKVQLILSNKVIDKTFIIAID